ncbi:flagellar biosynthesis protein FlhF [Gilvimarinus algae]|uniref:Flagellar biosynthesis protein FlhF n=1 Tax=Gilvimarinus algae TaxID=3058037 RepID=A0ABT8TEV5_9GAMM|nr:flagellar biosynthesis protein FlhF [Gilvimarinus sp. SDUM040014]MDO3382578.1 flagellar biosynthesis protein FlhF [Gilvimarinus sp. SDUM040014]
MQVKRFVAKDMRRALELVRQELGEDAIILSSRRVKEGVEILTSGGAPASAVAPAVSENANTAAPFAAEASHKLGKSGADIAADIELASRRLAAKQLTEASADEFLRDNQVVNAGIRVQGHSSAEHAPARTQSAAERYGLLETPAPAAVTTANASNDIDMLHEEIAQMRLLLEEQLGRLGASPRGPGKAQLSGIGQRLERLGFSERVCRAVLKKPLSHRLVAKAWPEAMARMAKAVPVAGKDVTAAGGVFAFVGPTGAGKTTTVAKLAARYVMKHGADKVALVTTDTQRLAGHDQLRSLARILRVPLRVVDANNPLPSVLRSLRRCELVLIDTAGMRHGDPQLKQQMQQLAGIARIKSYLVLPSNSQPQMLKAAVHAYREAALEGCVLTKLDETASLGEAVDCAIQARLPIAYTTHGQDIPEDIELARGYQLISRAAQLAQAAASARKAQG